VLPKSFTTTIVSFPAILKNWTYKNKSDNKGVLSRVYNSSKGVIYAISDGCGFK
jgi:hypothetical protein